MRRPEPLVLAVFVLIVLVGGSNFVAVRFSNRELPPFWGAAIRFAASAALLLLAAWRMRLPLARGPALRAVALFGIINFGLSYALAYWGLLEAPAALASTIFSLVPLLTFFMAVAQGMERFRWGGVVGGLVAVAGIVVVFADQLRATVAPASLLALFAAAVTAAFSTILAKRLPRAQPVATNAVAMLPGAAFLLALSLAAREPAILPTHPEVWAALVYLAFSTIALFVGFLYVVARWSASSTAYAIVLFPIVTVALGAILAGELVSLPFVLGAALVMLGAYVGAAAQPAPTPAVAPQAPRAS